MSAKPASGKKTPDATRDDAPPDINAYAIEIPDAFIDAYDGDTVAEKLRAAERAPSTTEREDMGRCPACGSVCLSPKPGYDSQHDHPGTLVCTNCRAHLGVPGGAEGFDGAAEPARPTQWVAPAPWADTYHLVDGCETVTARPIEATAAELDARGLTPCQCDACQPAAEWRRCDACGQPTFGAVEGIPLAVCADCVEVSDDE